MTLHMCPSNTDRARQGGSSGAEGVVIAESPAGNAQELAS